MSTSRPPSKGQPRPRRGFPIGGDAGSEEDDTGSEGEDTSSEDDDFSSHEEPELQAPSDSQVRPPFPQMIIIMWVLD